MSGPLDDFLTQCVQDCVGPASPDPQSATTEPTHSHVCPICMDSWRHDGSECEAEDEVVAGYLRPRTWAKCPIHEGEVEG